MLQEISQANGHSYTRPRPDEIARGELARISSIIASTPIEPRGGLVEALKFCAAEIEEMLEAGVIDQPEGNDAIWDGLVQAGAVEKIGVDGAHQLMADAFRRRECEKSEEQSGECGSEALFAARCLADVDTTPIRWLWKGRFARGKINMVGGVPGLGKSQVACAFIAAVTAGGLWPDGGRAPLGSVIIIGCEDDAADTIRPRLEAAGADLSKVHLFDWALVTDKKGKSERRHFDVREHKAALAQLIAQIGDVVLIIIDPITAHLGRTDSHVTAEVRAALAPLQTLAAETLAAVILISHLNKGGGGDGSAMNRVTGSGAFIAVCRSAWLIAGDPKDAEKRRRILAPIKNNLGDDKTGFAYTIEGVTLPNGIGTSRVVFDPIRVHVSADELLQQITPAAEEAKGARDEACEFLRTFLKDGPVSAQDLETARKAHQIAPATLKRARKALGVQAKKVGEGWHVQMPRPSPRAQAYQEHQEDHS